MLIWIQSSDAVEVILSSRQLKRWEWSLGKVLAGITNLQVFYTNMRIETWMSFRIPRARVQREKQNLGATSKKTQDLGA